MFQRKIYVFHGQFLGLSLRFAKGICVMSNGNNLFLCVSRRYFGIPFEKESFNRITAYLYGAKQKVLEFCLNYGRMMTKQNDKCRNVKGVAVISKLNVLCVYKHLYTLLVFIPLPASI